MNYTLYFSLTAVQLIMSAGLCLFLLMYFTWAAYLCVMNLMQHQKQLTLAAKFFAYPLAAAGVVLDVLLNMIVGTLLFLEIPRELMFTARLQRQIETGLSWRANVAHWLCANLLDPFDARGYHCQKPKE
jgi:hypothetical protein